MTWGNDVEVEFQYNDQVYCASADVVVTLEKEDIGPVGYHDHYESYVADEVEIENLMVGDFGENIPEDIKESAEEAITEVARRRAEEAMA
jgi:hypothetical protein